MLHLARINSENYKFPIFTVHLLEGKIVSRKCILYCFTIKPNAHTKGLVYAPGYVPQPPATYETKVLRWSELKGRRGKKSPAGLFSKKLAAPNFCAGP